MKQSESIYKKIQHALNDLPGESAHHEMYPLRKTVSKVDLLTEDYRVSAVLALMYSESSSIKMVLTQRHDYQGKHGGQVSFPGGKMEKEDADTITTALRETKEEIGVSEKKIGILGKLTDVYIPVSKFLVHPYIGYHEGTPRFVRSEYEVKEIISFDLRSLFNDSIKTKRNISTKDGVILKDIPCFIIDDRIVWGATALMLNEIRLLLMHLKHEF